MMKVIKLAILLLFTCSIAQAQTKDWLKFYYEAKDTDGQEAIDILTQGIKAYPDETTLYLTRASVYMEEQQYTLAEADARKALSIEEKSTAAMFILSNSFEYRGDTKEADLYLKKIEKTDKNDAMKFASELVTGAGYASLDNEDEVKEAIRTCQRAILLYPMVSSYLVMAEFQIHAKQYGEASATYHKLLSFTKDKESRQEAYVGLAIACHICAEKKVDEYLAAAVAEDASMTLKKYFEKKGVELESYNSENYMQVMNRWARIAPNDYMMLYHRGAYYYTNREYQKAIDSFTVGIETAGSRKVVDMVDLLYYLYRGEAYHHWYHQNDNADLLPLAETDFTKVISLVKDVEQAYQYRAEVRKHMFELKYFADGTIDHELAKLVFEDLDYLYERDDTNAYIYRSRAVINYYLSGEETEEVLKNLELAEKYAK
ncbi:hypothetical protein ORI89_06790 [Sphingobacterium sp. UT-1RO-CII-1]|uniref:hypothetical protein n=1 Tax=Sphingobacterium sp. UT-1RO-CII-1 TaxID=2995225 RepID=UPI00227A310B|nr:hypothetical protein [Sphingobacterium sp. UT-1RO-CII-1]MCY4779349.1 hypothetical protein [Sphingobacterium sp. UT-1RO-CII-1]